MRKIGVSVIAACVLLAMSVTPIFADIDAGTKPIIAYSNKGGNVNLGNNVNVYYDVYNLLAELQTIDVDKNQDSSNPKYYSNFAVSQQYTVFFKFFNFSSQPKRISPNYGYVDITINRNTFNNNQLSNVGYHVDSVDNCYCEIGSTGRVYMYPLDNSIYDSGIFLPPNGSYSMSVTFTKTYNVTIEGYADVPVLELYNQQITGVSLPTYATTVLSSDILTTNIDYNLYRIWQNTDAVETYLNSLNNNVISILDAYRSNAQNISNTNNQIDSTQSTVDNVHQQEQQWYTQNQQAIEAAGLSNEKLTDSKYQGVYPVANDFGQLWTSIGPTKYIYLFALMASLAAFMLRHKPFSHAGKEINYQTKTLR